MASYVGHHHHDIRVGGIPRLLTHVLLVTHTDAVKGDRDAAVWLSTVGRRWLERLGATEAMIEEYMNSAPQRQMSDPQRWDVGWGKKREAS